MILRTFRDVEIEFRKLIAQIEHLSTADDAKLGQFLTKAEIVALIKRHLPATPIIDNTLESQPPDLDGTNHNGTILHRLPHKFFEPVEVDDIHVNGELTGWDPNPFQRIVISRLPVEPGEWTISNEVDNEQLRFTFTGKTGFAFVLDFLSNGPTPVDWYLIYEGNVGNSTQRVSKIWTTDLSVLTGTPPTPGQVLTAVDTVGNVKWSTPATGGFTSFEVFATNPAPYFLTTAQTPIPGVAFNLTVLGKYLVIMEFTIDKRAADDLAVSRMIAGATIVGEVLVGNPSGLAMDNMYMTSSSLTFLNVTAATNVYMTAWKVTGVGGSVTSAGQSKLRAVYLGP